jgi:hypothetical protein
MSLLSPDILFDPDRSADPCQVGAKRCPVSGLDPDSGGMHHVPDVPFVAPLSGNLAKAISPQVIVLPLGTLPDLQSGQRDLAVRQLQIALCSEPNYKFGSTARAASWGCSERGVCNTPLRETAAGTGFIGYNW